MEKADKAAQEEVCCRQKTGADVIDGPRACLIQGIQALCETGASLRTVQPHTWIATGGRKGALGDGMMNLALNRLSYTGKDSKGP